MLPERGKQCRQSDEGFVLPSGLLLYDKGGHELVYSGTIEQLFSLLVSLKRFLTIKYGTCLLIVCVCVCMCVRVHWKSLTRWKRLSRATSIPTVGHLAMIRNSSYFVACFSQFSNQKTGLD